MAYIDKELVEQLKTACIARYPLSYVDGIFAFAREIEDIPTADVVEVVRCKDCKSYTVRTQASVKWNGKALHCVRSRRVVKPNDFCSYGERKDK
jgi:hypothetical protein